MIKFLEIVDKNDYILLLKHLISELIRRIRPAIRILLKHLLEDYKYYFIAVVVSHWLFLS